MTDDRLNRIETKIDKLNDVLATVARIEEKIMSVEKDNEFVTQRLLKKETKLIELEKKVDDASRTLAVLTRVFWIVLTTLVSTAIGSAWVYLDRVGEAVRYAEVQQTEEIKR
jgi:vacuolar-type H+-ATPase subunit I/STV1